MAILWAALSICWVISVFDSDLASALAISPRGPNRNPGGPDIDELPGTEGYDAETGFMMPNKKCVEMQLEIQEDCETDPHLATDDDRKSCDRKRAKWMSKCVFGDGGDS